MMLTAEKYKLSTQTTCFYSIKLGGLNDKVLRQECLKNNQIAINFGMTEDRHEQLMALRHDEPAFLKFLNTEPDRKTAYWDNQHRYFYRSAPKAVWLTVDQGFLYYAEDLDAPSEESFSTVTADKWIKRQVKQWQKVAIPVSKLPGVIRNLSVQRQTIVEISDKQKHDLFVLISNVINQEKPLVKAYQDTYQDRAGSIEALVQKLDPSDFETLIDMILYRMSYTRESVLGDQEKAFDGIYKDLRNDTDTLYVQVKCKAGLNELKEFTNDYLALRAEDENAKALFAFHSAATNKLLDAVVHSECDVWDGSSIAKHVIRLGLEPWILDRVYA